jgi:hypothetical protein
LDGFVSPGCAFDCSGAASTDGFDGDEDIICDSV